MTNIINYISSASIPVIIVFILVYGLKEKNKVFDTFLKGSKEGIEIVLKMFPTLIGIFFSSWSIKKFGIDRSNC